MDEKKVFGEEYKYFLTRVKRAKTILSELEAHTSIRKEDKLKVLAVGGEYGFIEFNLSKWTKWKITSSDLDKKLITRYPELSVNIEMKVLDSTDLPYKEGSFDLVIFNHVIEHIPQYNMAVKELHRVLKKGGWMYLATPNLYRLFVNAKILLYPKKGLDDNIRIARHMGFSLDELYLILKPFSKRIQINKEHMINNLGILKPIGMLLPEAIYRKNAQTNVVICRK